MGANIKGEGSEREREKRGNTDVLMLVCLEEEEAGLGADRGAETRYPAALGSVRSDCEHSA